MRNWLIEKLGGYTSAEQAIRSAGGYLTIQEAINAIEKKDAVERNKILTLAVKKLFNTIGADDILHQRADGEWVSSGKVLTQAQKELLKAEAAQLLSMSLWKILETDILYQVNKKMYLLSENDLHVVTAKFWLYTFDAMRTKLKQIQERVR